MSEQSTFNHQEQQEEWRDIPGHPGYQASTFGRIRSSRRGKSKHHEHPSWRVLSPFFSGRGYLVVGLGGRKKEYVHRLVLLTFVGPCPDGMEARHVYANDKTNNKLGNLSWGTRAENQHDRISHGTSNQGEAAPASKLTASQVADILRRIANGERRNDLAAEYGIRRENVSRITSGQHWKHLGLPLKTHKSDLIDHLSTQEAATIIGVSRERVQQLIKAGRMSGVPTRNGLYIPRTDVMTELNRRQRSNDGRVRSRG